MKTMTCRDMGGPCDAKISGSTQDEMMNNGGQHVHEMAAQGDEEHKKVEAMMEEMQKDPESGKQWMEEFTAKYNALPEE